MTIYQDWSVLHIYIGLLSISLIALMIKDSLIMDCESIPASLVGSAVGR